jgi:hypothetical protein
MTQLTQHLDALALLTGLHPVRRHRRMSAETHSRPSTSTLTTAVSYRG